MDTQALAQSFAAHVAHREGLGDVTALLAAHYTDGAAAWPAIALAPAAFGRWLAERVNARTDESPDHVVRTMPAADAYIAAACATGDARAVAAFHAAYVPGLRHALGRLGAPAATIDEAIQRVAVMLFVGEGGPPQIATYGGRGTLRSWLRTIGVRTCRRLAGTLHGRATGPTSDDELDALPSAVLDPQEGLLRAAYADRVRAAFVAAFGHLSRRERNVLRQYHLDGLTIDQLAALYSINRATAARWVIAARRTLLAATRELLAEELAVDPDDVDSILRLVASQLDPSVRGLADSAPA